MTQPLPILQASEIERCRPLGDEPGFGALRTERGLLPLRSLNVDSRITGLLAETTVRQAFVNPFAQPLEATYIFPLPDRAAVIRFRMEVGDRVVEGLLQEREQARQTYDQAIRTGHRAAIAEEERPGVFTMRVGNLMPQETATVELTLAGPLPIIDGEATFRFPLVVAPRYIPGAPLADDAVGDGTSSDTDRVPDASRISPPVLLPGHPNPVRLSLGVTLDPTGLERGLVRSSLHTVSSQIDATGALRLDVLPGERLDRDFILRFPVGGAEVGGSATATADREGDEGTFVCTVLPPLIAAPTKPRDVVFVLDRSGSMGGWKMVAARRAVARMVDSLLDCDRFAVLAFDTQVDAVPGHVGLVEARDRARFQAVGWLAGVEARGGTEMLLPLEQAATLLSASTADRERILILATDGQVGNEDEILRRLKARLQGTRVATIGIDQAVNMAFLRRLADLGRGWAEQVESEERLDAVMVRLHRAIGQPLVTDLCVEGLGIRIVSDCLEPASADLFPGVPVLLAGRFAGPSQGSIRIRGKDAQGKPFERLLPLILRDGRAIPATWARARVRSLEDRFVTGTGNRGLLEQEILRTSLRFGVLCRFTAFVAVDGAEVVNVGGLGHRMVVPVEQPAGWAAPMGAPAPCPAPAVCQSMPLRASIPSSAPRAASADKGKALFQRRRAETCANVAPMASLPAPCEESLDRSCDTGSMAGPVGGGVACIAPPPPTDPKTILTALLARMTACPPGAFARVALLAEILKALELLLAGGLAEPLATPVRELLEHIRILMQGDLEPAWAEVQEALVRLTSKKRRSFWKA